MNRSALSIILKENNCRLTNARIEIYKILQNATSSLNVKEIFKKLEGENIDRVSVYRNLILFEEIGLAHKFQNGSFSICKHDQKHQGHDHVHFISSCTLCGKKSEIENHSAEICTLAKQLKKLSSPLKTVNEIIIQGQCSRCTIA